MRSFTSRIVLTGLFGAVLALAGATAAQADATSTGTAGITHDKVTEIAAADAVTSSWPWG